MKRVLLFLVRLIIISVLLVPLLSLFHYLYAAILMSLLDAATTGTRAPLPYDASRNMYTFIVLILATPGLAIKKRVLAVGSGVGLFLSADVFMMAVWTPYLKTPQPSLANMAVSYGWPVVAHYLLPFLLWFAFAFRQVERMFRGDAYFETATL